MKTNPEQHHPNSNYSQWYGDAILTTKNYTAILLTFLFISPIKIFSQSGNIDQVRNGPANNPQKNFYVNFNNPEWINGNAGASNAHYVEGMSIPYRALITGVTSGQSYEYIIEYDTKHSGRMAIDYLTHYERLEPHGPFGHPAEMIDPLIFKSGNLEYRMNSLNKDTMSIPAPFQSNANTPIAGMPQNSFNALPDSQRVMTIYHGELLDISYVTQQSLTSPANDATTSVKIRFKALDDSVLLVWGGHIASRLDWDYLNPTTPRSASGISGSPYHMRQLAMNTWPGLVNISLGNQDRSLSAAAVIPPPECKLSPAQLACTSTDSLIFSYTGSTSGVKFKWTINAGNSAGAVISGSDSGSTVKIVPGGTDFIAGGTFNLTLAVTANAITQTCTLSPAGTIQNIAVTATAYPESIDFATGDTTTLTANATPVPNSLYTFSWLQIPAGGGTLNSTTDSIVKFKATAAGTDSFIVTITQKALPNCVAKDTVVVAVGAASPPCEVTGPSPICPGTTNTYNGPGGTIPENFSYKWTLDSNSNSAAIIGADNDTSVSVQAGTSCNTSYIVHLHIESSSGLIKKDCYKKVFVQDTIPPTMVSCPQDTTMECSADTAAVNTGTATATDNCSATVTYSDQVLSQNCFTYINRTWTATDPCGNTSTCVQRIILTDRTAPVITCATNVNVNCGDTIPAPPVSDNCTASPNITLLHRDVPAEASGCQDNPFNLNRTWTAIDASGNISTCTQHITFVALSLARVSSTATAPAETETTKPAIPVRVNSTAMISYLQVNAIPNPFSGEITFRFTPLVSGQASLVLYNLVGARVAVVYNGRVVAGVPYSIKYYVPSAQRIPLVYKLNVGTQTAQGKLLSIERAHK